LAKRNVHPLRRIFDGVERTVGRPLEQASNNPQAAGVLIAVTKVSRFGLRQARGAREMALHLWELPTHRDIEELETQVGRLQRSVDELTQQLQDREEPRRG
jgi:hypothetical protein